ncbi:MAG: FecR domain-containing protein [Devosia sp.]|nr:FecR domain-containing protein [Devosia sp.]
MSRVLLGILAFVLGLGASGLAVAADGAALGVDAGATAQTGRQVRMLTVGADLFIGDKVETDATGLVQVKFADSTELVIGPNSTLVLEDYLLRADGSAGRLAVNALAGTFRFVTGNAPKDRYSITTPTGTIGVRGTAFDFTVDKETTSVLLFHGEAILCAQRADCVTLDDTCEVGQYELRQSQIIGLSGKVGAEERKELRAKFRYASSQKPLLRDFRVRSAENCLKQTVAEEQAEKQPVPVVVPPVDPCAEPGSCEPPPPPPPPPPDDPKPPKPPKDDHHHDDHHDNGHHYDGDHHDPGRGHGRDDDGGGRGHGGGDKGGRGKGH